MTEVLKTAIEESGLTRYQIAKETGITEPSIMRFMSGETSLRLDKADKLAASRFRPGEKRPTAPGVLAPGATVSWRVDLPPNLKSARFRTRVRATAGDPMLARGARATLSDDTGEARVFVPAGGREPLSLDLLPFVGRSVTLRILAEEAGGGATPLIFEAPKIELRVDG